MGSPGKVVRQLDEAAAQRNTLSALHYQQNMRKFRDTLKPLA
jgi:carbonic anhydrase/acetyltransferase-like protein (isoleucine patch superfamily)